MRKVKSYNVFNESVRNTSVRDHMKPRSRKDIRDSIEKMSDEDYESYMVDEIVPYNKFNMIFNDTKYRKIYKEMIIDGKKKGIVPSDLAKQISDMYHQLNNTGKTSEEIYKDHIDHIRAIGLDESVRDMMKPKSEEEIQTAIKKLDNNEINLYRLNHMGYIEHLTKEQIEKGLEKLSFGEQMNFGIDNNLPWIIDRLNDAGYFEHDVIDDDDL